MMLLRKSLTQSCCCRKCCCCRCCCCRRHERQRQRQHERSPPIVSLLRRPDATRTQKYAIAIWMNELCVTKNVVIWWKGISSFASSLRIFLWLTVAWHFLNITALFIVRKKSQFVDVSKSTTLNWRYELRKWIKFSSFYSVPNPKGYKKDWTY